MGQPCRSPCILLKKPSSWLLRLMVKVGEVMQDSILLVTKVFAKHLYIIWETKIGQKSTNVDGFFFFLINANEVMLIHFSKLSWVKKSKMARMTSSLIMSQDLL